MASGMDTSLHYTDHFVEHGFAVIKGLVDRDLCAAALKRVGEIIENPLPPNEWTLHNAKELYKPFVEGFTPPDPVLDQISEHPRLMAVIDEMFGELGWNRKRNYYLFLKAYNPDGPAMLQPRGHIDFPNQPIPLLYRGFVLQVSLIDSEPFSGNITHFPGTHKTVQKFFMDHPDMQMSATVPDIPIPEPVEFVAEAGDVVMWHHLVLHEGNPSHAANRTPRVALTMEAFRDEFLRKVDPADPNLSPWERSLAHNGYYEETRDEIERNLMAKRDEYFESLRPKSV